MNLTILWQVRSMYSATVKQGKMNLISKQSSFNSFCIDLHTIPRPMYLKTLILWSLLQRSSIRELDFFLF